MKQGVSCLQRAVHAKLANLVACEALLATVQLKRQPANPTLKIVYRFPRNTGCLCAYWYVRAARAQISMPVHQQDQEQHSSADAWLPTARDAPTLLPPPRFGVCNPFRRSTTSNIMPRLFLLPQQPNHHARDFHRSREDNSPCMHRPNSTQTSLCQQTATGMQGEHAPCIARLIPKGT